MTVEILARQDDRLYPAAFVHAHQDSIRDATTDAKERQWLSQVLPEIALTLEVYCWRVCVVDVSTNRDSTLLLSTTSNGPQDDVSAAGRLRAVLPARLLREPRPALLRGVAMRAPATVLPDRLALWDLLARAATHLAVRGLDPAQQPTGAGSVMPTSTRSLPGSLWPPEWVARARADGNPAEPASS